MAHLSSMEPIMRYTSRAGTECFAFREHRQHSSLSHVAKAAQHRCSGTCYTCLHAALNVSQSTHVCRAMATAALGQGRLLLLVPPASLNIPSPLRHPSLNPLLSSSRPTVMHSMRLRSAQPSALVTAQETLLRSPRLLLPRCVSYCNPCRSCCSQRV